MTRIPVFLDFEKPLYALEAKIGELRHLAENDDINISDEIAELQAKMDKFLHQTYAKLSAWQKVQVARHPHRPHFSDYITGLLEDFTPLSGDRCFSDDPALQGGIGRFHGRSIIILGHEKGTDTQSRMAFNFGMARPEGYRKAIRLVELANRFNLPILTLVDTPGAYPGIEAEKRGQAEAIARSTQAFLTARIPIISAIIGEGGSGGAVAIAAADCVLMLEHAVYSVISPEGCASILWRNSDKAEEAATAMKITATDLLKIGIIDQVVPEPLGGAHRNPQNMIHSLGEILFSNLKPLLETESETLCQNRRAKFLNMSL